MVIMIVMIVDNDDNYYDADEYILMINSTNTLYLYLDSRPSLSVGT